MQRQGLYRSRKDRIFGGVAGGIANALNADPAIIRLIFAILVIIGGGGLLLYAILWIAIPEEPYGFFQDGQPNPSAGGPTDGTTPTTPYQPSAYPARKSNGALIVGLILIVIGALFLIGRFLPQFRFHFHDFWPLIIVVAGIALIVSSFSGIKKS